jgi:DnaJ-class molecular chaperone
MPSEKPKGNENSIENSKENMERVCTSCNGTGIYTPPPGIKVVRENVPCQKCHGTGMTVGK